MWRKHTHDNGISGKTNEDHKKIFIQSLQKKFKSKPSNIEHDIRTIVNVCWENHRERLEEIAGYPLEYRPTNSEFVDMIAFYLGDEKESKVPDVECQNGSVGKIMENLF